MANVAPPSYGAPPGQTLDFDETSFNNLVRRYELNPMVASQLRDVLQHREIVLLCDDSSSMQNLVIEEGNDPFAQNNTTRWMLLKKIAASIIDFVTATSHRGLDLYFLKRDTVRGVRSRDGLQAIFAQPPDEMGTPLLSALRRIFHDKQGHVGLLIVVITDGEPNDGNRDDLRRLLLSKPRDCHVSFAEATDQEDDMAYLDQLKGVVPLFDNTDIYRVEAQRVKNIQGQQFKFDWTDYVIKILLATFLSQYWNVDQRRVYGGGQRGYNTNYSNTAPVQPPMQMQQQQAAYYPPPQQQQQLQQGAMPISPAGSPYPAQPQSQVLAPAGGGGYYPNAYQANAMQQPPPNYQQQQQQSSCCVIL